MAPLRLGLVVGGVGAITAIPLNVTLGQTVTSPSNVPIKPRADTGKKSFLDRHNPVVNDVRRREWIKAHGFQQNFEKIHEMLVREKGEDLRTTRIAQYLAVLHTPEELTQLKSRGVDVLGAYMGRGSRSTDALVDVTDVMLLGEIININSNAYDTDTYASTVTVLVHEVLKGDTTLDTIRFRRFSGCGSPRGGCQSSSNDFSPSKNTLYLFRVSARLYPLYILSAGGEPVSPDRKYYVLQENPRPVTKSQMLKPPYVCLGPPMEDISLEDVRASAARYKQ